ncbi:phosphinothricin N-acetyltransferase [Mycolicibacterium litorale]|uniref:Phosphinothricin N-acetyltransferase n=1 Tax=Mycolicibacterium litorale TaxID=758802 RepID=A0A6S6P7F5_9MYCO|nr:GNAT family N-acetyltransferase [Mycolicibacterium litorale]BCI53357.1 phosphinothricin N-acetyltransferase [Mycolicibacterium litorale]
MTVRDAEARDLTEIGRIYAYHVTTGVATFEVTPPDAGEWHRRWTSARANGLPFLVVERDGGVAGYAYCSPWKPRPAYRHTVENSIYLAPEAIGLGLGGRLLDVLLERCVAAGLREVIAVVVDADAAGSLALHRKRGFSDAGRLTRVGFKHGRWLDTLLLQRSLAPANPSSA